MKSTKQPCFSVSAVMFDLDGTLIDSINVYFSVVETVFEQMGLPPVSRKAIYSAVDSGRFSWHKVLPAELQPQSDDIVPKAITRAREIYPTIFRREVDFFEGVHQLLAEIQTLGVKCGVVTATPSDNMAEKYRLLNTKGISETIATVVTNDGAPHPKPAPDTLWECCRRLGVKPQQTLYVGDTAIDISAGRAAGSKTVAVLTGFDNRDTLEKENPDIILERVTDLSGMIAKAKSHR